MNAVPDIKTASADELMAHLWPTAFGVLLIRDLVAERDRLRAELARLRAELAEVTAKPEPEEDDNTIHRIEAVCGAAWAEVRWDEGRATIVAIQPFETGWVAGDDLCEGSLEAWQKAIEAEAARDADEARADALEAA